MVGRLAGTRTHCGNWLVHKMGARVRVAAVSSLGEPQQEGADGINPSAPSYCRHSDLTANANSELNSPNSRSGASAAADRGP